MALDLMVGRKDERGHPAKNIQVRNHEEFEELFCIFSLYLGIHCSNILFKIDVVGYN